MKSNSNLVKKFAVTLNVLILSGGMIACSNNNTEQANSQVQNNHSGTKNETNAKQPPWYKGPSEEQLKAVQMDNASNTIVSSGPYGEKAIGANEIQITKEQMAKIKAGDFTAAIAMGFLGDDWSAQQLAGLKSEFKKLGIKVIAETNANFKDTTQISDLETIKAKKPNILISIPLNAQTTARTYKAIADSGTKIVFMDQPAEGMKAGKDYVSVVSADSFGLGMNIADELAKAIGGKGDVAALYYAPDFYVTNQRYEGFAARLKAKYPDINLIAVQGFQDPNKTQEVAGALLTRYPKLKGMYASWDVPAMGALAAARVAGKTPEEFKVVNENLGNEVALAMANNDFIAGIGSQRPFDQGVAEARQAALAIIGAETHPYVAVPSLAVNRSNLEKSYQEIYHKDANAEILKALTK
ncbi:substrate-binding domain-containing protein [Neobacillus cucumis]|uniref:substrate-binding domain-containing protein n=1 Tax=Neobacillus cucumis TaxID=1740721 RepID=UPI0028536911|nr:substrate-binding domain-containing protein [Neobacillus cucumis]MDR4949383.1 substrate-binding domain-containing protein [Neobacillus cucumis]